MLTELESKEDKYFKELLALTSRLLVKSDAVNRDLRCLDDESCFNAMTLLSYMACYVLKDVETPELLVKTLDDFKQSVFLAVCPENKTP